MLSPDSHLKRGFASPHEELYHDLERRHAKWNVTKEYSDELLTGAAVQLGSRSDLVKLAGACTRRVWLAAVLRALDMDLLRVRIRDTDAGRQYGPRMRQHLSHAGC